MQIEASVAISIVSMLVSAAISWAIVVTRLEVVSNKVNQIELTAVTKEVLELKLDKLTAQLQSIVEGFAEVKRDIRLLIRSNTHDLASDGRQ